MNEFFSLTEQDAGSNPAISTNLKMKVTIVVRTYNRQKFLEEALASIELQTHSDWEVILFDDGADDTNFHIYKNFKKRNPTKRIVYFTTNTQRELFSQSWLISPDLAEGEIIVRLDDDDILASDSLEFLSELYTKNTELDFSFGSCLNFTKKDGATKLVETRTPFEIEKVRSTWAAYIIPNNHPWKHPWSFIEDYYDEPQHWTSLIHCSKANIFCVYHTYAMRTSSVKRVKDKIQLRSKFADDLEFLGSLEYLGLAYNSIKKILSYVRVHDEGRVSDDGIHYEGVRMRDDILELRDNVEYLRPSGFLPKIINLDYQKDFEPNAQITEEMIRRFRKFYNKINYKLNPTKNTIPVKLVGTAINLEVLS